MSFKFFLRPLSMRLLCPPIYTLFPYTTLFRSALRLLAPQADDRGRDPRGGSKSERGSRPRSEEHTSELQSLTNLVCRLLLEKKKQKRRQEGERTRPS